MTPRKTSWRDFLLTRQDDGSFINRLQVRLTVIGARAALVTTDLPQALLLQPGVAVSGTITANESGGTSPFTIDAAPIENVSVTLGQQTVLTGGTGGDNLTATAPVTLMAAADAAPGAPVAPLLINWSIPGDAGHAPESGTIQVSLGIAAPAEITLQQDVVTPSGTALGGTVSITIRSDGSYSFTTHMHDSGFDPYNFTLRAVLRTASGVQLVLQQTGSVTGTVGDGSRDDDHSSMGSTPGIGDNWADAATATMKASAQVLRRPQGAGRTGGGSCGGAEVLRHRRSGRSRGDGLIVLGDEADIDVYRRRGRSADQAQFPACW